MFAEAYSRFSQGEFSRAKELFRATLAEPFALEDYSLYFLGSIAVKEGDRDAARRAFADLKERHPQSIWFHRAEIQECRLLLAEKKYRQAKDALLALRTANGGKAEISNEASYLLAQIDEAQGDLIRSHARYQELRDVAPSSKWAAAARKEVVRLRTKYPERFGLTRLEAKIEEAERLTREREYGQAERLYRTIIDGTSDASRRPGLLMNLAEVYLAARNRRQALTLVGEIVRDFPRSAEAPNALYRLAQILWNRNENLAALDYFEKLIDEYPASPHRDIAHFAAADIQESLGNKEEAIALYKSIPVKFPGTRLAYDATWRLAWLYYLQGDFEKALATFKSLEAGGADDRYRTAALFWHARSAQKLGNEEEAERLLLQIVNAEEESYYQGPAARELAETGMDTDIEEPDGEQSPAVEESDPPLSAESAYHLSRAQALARLSLHSLAIGELDEINRLVGPANGFRTLLMREYAKNRAFARSVAIANGIPGPSDERERHRFPLAYWSMIQRKAEESGLDPYLILALIRQESLFDPRARSPASALGLMQLLPSTAARVARRAGLAPPATEKLFEPELNVTLGIRYLKDLLNRYANDWIKAIAAYNAGEDAVARWEKEIMTEDIEEFIERIPYAETRLYVKLVMRNHRIYKKLYDHLR